MASNEAKKTCKNCKFFNIETYQNASSIARDWWWYCNARPYIIVGVLFNCKLRKKDDKKTTSSMTKNFHKTIQQK